MSTAAASPVEASLHEIERLRQLLKKSRGKQVRTSDEKTLAKAVATTWFSTHRRYFTASDVPASLEDVDAGFRAILEASDRLTTRAKYLACLKKLKTDLIRLRSEAIFVKSPGVGTSESPPNFAPLISDPAMQLILASRWNECTLCLNANAALAATVMMGGLLEALLLSRVNREANKTPLFTAKATPKNAKDAKPKLLSEWMLNDFIQVLSELRWITASAGAVGSVLREYRNYIHPQKQLSHGVYLTPEDARLFWEVTKNIARQVVAGVP